MNKLEITSTTVIVHTGKIPRVLTWWWVLLHCIKHAFLVIRKEGER